VQTAPNALLLLRRTKNEKLGMESKRRRVIHDDDDDDELWNGDDNAVFNATIWTSIRDNRAANLYKCIHYKDADVNAVHPKTLQSPLAIAVEEGNLECAQVLIDAGAKGAIDILRKLALHPNGASRECRSVLMPGCTRDELRAWETECAVRPAHPEHPVGFSNGMQFVTANAAVHFTAWIEMTGMDSIRAPDPGCSLEDVARECGHRHIEHYLHARVVLTVLLCNRFGRAHGSDHPITRMPRDAAVYLMRNFFYSKLRCFDCQEPHTSIDDLSCVECRAIEIPCGKCRAEFPRMVERNWTPCCHCSRPICKARECRQICKGVAANDRDVRRSCWASLCKICADAHQGVCAECLDEAYSRGAGQIEGSLSSSSQ